jgi:hypothetical protein
MLVTRILLSALLLAGGSLIAQTPNSLTPGSAKTSASPLAPKEHKRVFSPKKSKAAKIRRGNVKHTARYEFYERVEKAAKEKQRLLRKLHKPQYSDPSYFGHKKKPKRRPPHKMRFCDECHIRH